MIVGWVEIDDGTLSSYGRHKLLHSITIGRFPGTRGAKYELCERHVVQYVCAFVVWVIRRWKVQKSAWCLYCKESQYCLIQITLCIY